MNDTIDPTTDLLVRTIYGEAANEPPEGWQGIAATAINRAKKSGKSISDELLAPNQYQAWQNPELKQRMTELSPSDPKYQAILTSVAPVVSGHITLPYTKYLNRDTTPKDATALNIIPGKPDSGWAINPGTKLGSHDFYSPKSDNTSGITDDDLAAAMGTAPTSGNSTEVTDADMTAAMGGVGPDIEITDPTKDTNPRIGNEAQQLAARRDQANNILTSDPKGGSLYNGHPVYMPNTPAAIAAIPEGSYYYDPEGKIQYSGKKEGDLGGGVLQGAEDVGLSALKLIPGTANDDIRQRLQSGQDWYDATRRGNPVSDLGRFGGQVLTTAPVLGAFGAGANAIGRAAPTVAPVVDFLGGKAGPGLLQRGLSLAANGAVQGAGAGIATNSTSSDSIGDQALKGAEIGMVAGPVLHGIGANIGSKFFPQIKPVQGAVDNQNIVDLANKADKFGLDLRATQMQGITDPKAAIRDQQLINSPGSGFATHAAEQPMKGTQAIASTFGVSPSQMPYGLTSDVLTQARKDVGEDINSVRATQAVTGKDVRNLIADMTNVVISAKKGGTDPTGIDALRNVVTGIKSLTRGTGTLTGDQYQELTAYKSEFDNLMNNKDSTTRNYAGQMKRVIDGYLNKGSSPDDLAKLSKAELQYKTIMAVDPLVKKSPTGIINLSDLQGAINNRFTAPASSGLPKAPIQNLADLGQLVPNFGAVPEKSKLSLKNIMTNGALGGAIAGVGEHFIGSGLAPSAAAAAGGLLVGATVGKRVSSVLGGQLSDNAFLRNRLLVNTPYDPSSLSNYITTPATTIPLKTAFQQNKGKK